MGLADAPSQGRADRQHKYDQSPHAKAQESSPGTRVRADRHARHFQLSASGTVYFPNSDLTDNRSGSIAYPPRESINRLMVDLGLDGLRRRRADFFDLQGVGRLEDCERGPEPDGWRNVGAGDQLPESRHRVRGQRQHVGPEPLPPKQLGPIQSRDELGIISQPFGHGLRLATRHVGPVRLGPGQDVDGPEPGERQAGFRSLTTWSPPR